MTLPTSTPSAEGVDAAGLLAFVEALQAHPEVELHGVAVARHGRVVARGGVDPYVPDRVQLVYSLSKVLTTTAIAFLRSEGLLDLDDVVVDLLGDSVSGEVDPRWREVRVKHCLAMTVGHTEDAWPTVVDRGDLGAVRADSDWLARTLAVPPTAEPGTVFAYNQVATYLLSLIVHRLAGGVRAVLRPRLLDPLGIGEVPWHSDPQGRELGFSGAHLCLDDVLSLAQFVLDGGSWQGRRLLHEDWFDRATVAVAPADLDRDPDWARGYGFSFWMQQAGFRGDGAFGQYLVVLPDQDMAVAITSEQERMQDTLDAFWEHVLPAVDRPGDAKDDQGLATALAGLRLAAPSGSVDVAEQVTFDRSGGDLAASWTEATVTPAGPGHDLVLERHGRRLSVAVGNGSWTSSTLQADGWALPVVAAGGWVDDNTFAADVRVVETPHVFHVRGHRGRGDLDLRWRLTPLMGRDPLALAVRRDDPETTVGASDPTLEDVS